MGMSKFLTLLGLLAAPLSFAVVASAQPQTQSAGALTEKELFEKILAQGVPEHGLRKIFDFRAQAKGAAFVIDTYTCKGKQASDVKPCEDKERTNTTKTVEIKDHDYAVVVDFKKPSTEKRLFVINLKTGDVESMLATHGKNSGGNYAYKFSNTKDSKQTSLGLYVTGEIYSGHYGPTLRLYGLEKSNDQAYNRDIVMHGAWYVDEKFPNTINSETKKPFGRMGVSWGCPAVSLANAKRLIPILAGGALIYHDYPELNDEALGGREVIGIDPEATKIDTAKKN